MVGSGRYSSKNRARCESKANLRRPPIDVTSTRQPIERRDATGACCNPAPGEWEILFHLISPDSLFITRLTFAKLNFGSMYR